MLPKSLLVELSKKYRVDYRVKKLPAIFFETIIKSLFSEGKTTLKALEAQFKSQQFQKFSLRQKNHTTIHRTAFHYRFDKIPSKFFRDLYEEAKKIYRKCFKKTKRDIWIFDSTVVSLSAKLLKNCGYKIKGSEKKKQIKYTIGIKNGFPEKVNLYGQKAYNSESRALGETILQTKMRKNSIILFDRGLKSRKVFDEITEKGLFFISRLAKNYKIKTTVKNTNPSKKKDTNIIKEQKGYLYSRHKKSKHTYRVIHVKPQNKDNQEKVIDEKVRKKALAQLKSEKNASKTKEDLIKDILTEDIIIVTNIPKKKMSTEKVAEMYKKRWYIETFFKFIKQEFNFSHFINRTENGIESMLYIVMICTLILFVYREKNELSGYKFVKRQFMFETEVDLVIEAFKKETDLLKVMLLLLAQFWEKIR